MRFAIPGPSDSWWQQKPVIVTAEGVPYLLLLVLATSIFTLTDEHGNELLINVALCVATALWMLGMYTLNPARRQQTPRTATFVAGLVVLTAALVIRDSWFGFFTVLCFAYSRALLRWPWRMAGAEATAAIAALSQTTGLQVSLLTHLAVFFIALALYSLFLPSLMWLLWEREEQLERHKQAAADLSEANLRLEATITENEGLHRALLGQAREAGVLDERRRMAQEIHDTIAQGLTGIVTQLQAAERAADQTPADPAGWRRHVTAATRLARESLSEARRSVDALRPEPLECGRLSEALAGVAERWSGLNGVPVQVTTTGTVRPIDPEAEFTLLRAAQEALANVARHARASRVGLTISYMENEVALDVRDDGVGFDPALANRGFGLVAMQQRIAALSGTLQVESEPGGGTAISACVPTVRALADS
ncbi:MAG TPA: sensor histidine kinase [Trebonia sp.]